MKILKIFLLCLPAFCVSCGSEPDKRSETSTTVDSSTIRNAFTKNLEQADDAATPDLQTVMDQYNESMGKGVIIDTIVKLSFDTLHIVLKHSSTNDSSIIIPSQYVSIYGIERFVTSPFQSHLVIFKNGKPFLDKKIEKANFISLADDSLQELGVLLYPYLRVCKEQIEIHYSFVIPLTDVGLNVGLKILNNGELIFSETRSC